MGKRVIENGGVEKNIVSRRNPINRVSIAVLSSVSFFSRRPDVPVPFITETVTRLPGQTVRFQVYEAPYISPRPAAAKFTALPLFIARTYRGGWANKVSRGIAKEKQGKRGGWGVWEKARKRTDPWLLSTRKVGAESWRGGIAGGTRMNYTFGHGEAGAKLKAIARVNWERSVRSN